MRYVDKFMEGAVTGLAMWLVLITTGVEVIVRWPS